MRWGFYGRRNEQRTIQDILNRGRWFFCQISGRRRIGKTALITEVMEKRAPERLVYITIPDSDPHGVIQSVRDALEDCKVPLSQFEIPSDLKSFAKLTAELCRHGYYVVLDEFQYFHRKLLFPFCSFLQAEVDALGRSSVSCAGGLFVLGSIHTEMMAILEDRTSPLFNRVTDRLEVQHFDHTTLREMFAAHGIDDPQQILFLWSMFEGVPKFYRDCFEQGVFSSDADYRLRTLQRLYFEGSSPLRNEAENWFLREFRGRYDVVLKLIAQSPGCSYADLKARHRELDSSSEEKQLGGYIKVLTERYQMIEKRQPVFAPRVGKKNRYYIRDNFLQAWLGALERQVRASRVRPHTQVIPEASRRMEVIEGFALEKFIASLLEELSSKGRGPIALTEVLKGYWDRPDMDRQIEIDFIGFNESDREILFGSCKRSAARHTEKSADEFAAVVDFFLNTKRGRRFARWRVRRALCSPTMGAEQQARLSNNGFEIFTIPDLWSRLSTPS